jgi:hypothetical protein
MTKHVLSYICDAAPAVMSWSEKKRETFFAKREVT